MSRFRWPRLARFPGLAGIYGVQKLLATLMNLSKLPRHFDEAIKNFLDSLMSHQTLTAQLIRFLFQSDKPSEFSRPQREPTNFLFVSGPARGLSRDPS